MAICKKCGAEVEDGINVCPACGEAMEEEKKTEEAAAPAVNQEDINKLYAILAYIGILFIIPLLLAKDSSYVRFHTNQGIILFIAGLICGIIPIIGWICSVVVFVFMILGIINAFKGEEKELPLIGRFKILK